MPPNGGPVNRVFGVGKAAGKGIPQDFQPTPGSRFCNHLVLGASAEQGPIKRCYAANGLRFVFVSKI